MGQLQSPSIILFPVLGFCCGALFPSHHWLISEGRNKNAACPTCVVHVQSLTHFYQNEAILFKWRMRGRQSYVLVQRKRECCIFFLTSWVSGFCFLAHWGCLPTHAGWKVLAHIAFFAHWVQQWREVSGGGGGSPPQYSKFSGKSSSQALPVTKYLRGYFAQGTKMPWWYLVKSLQNCLITVLNVRHLCNLNVRYKFEFLSFFYFY